MPKGKYWEISKYYLDTQSNIPGKLIMYQNKVIGKDFILIVSGFAIKFYLRIKN